MKLMKTAMVMVMVLGAAAATGCNKLDASAGLDGAQQDGVAAASTNDFTFKLWERWSGPRIVRPAPPPPRYEYPGVAPSPSHVWTHGYWRWDHDRTNYVWAPGYWVVQVAPAAPPAIRIEVPGPAPTARSFWVRGYWQWTGSQWKWVGGHWDVSRDGFTYAQPHWEMINGSWRHIPGRWVAAR